MRSGWECRQWEVYDLGCVDARCDLRTSVLLPPPYHPSGILDDGRGKARVSLFRHKHEIETGRTSSVGMEILGFAPSGQPILPSAPTTSDPETAVRREKLGWEEISQQSAKIVSFIGVFTFPTMSPTVEIVHQT